VAVGGHDQVQTRTTNTLRNTVRLTKSARFCEVIELPATLKASTSRTSVSKGTTVRLEAKR